MYIQPKRGTLDSTTIQNKENISKCLDLTLGGSVQSGESSNQGAERELLEELGLKHDFSNERPLLTFNFKQGFDDYYVFEEDVDLNDVSFKDNEVQAVKWATKNEIIQMIKEKVFIPYHIPFIESIFDLYKKKCI